MNEETRQAFETLSDHMGDEFQTAAKELAECLDEIERHGPHAADPRKPAVDLARALNAYFKRLAACAAGA